jgi:hypothetical protein
LFIGHTQVSAGVKITNERGVHPITGKPFLLQMSDEDE